MAEREKIKFGADLICDFAPIASNFLLIRYAQGIALSHRFRAY